MKQCIIITGYIEGSISKIYPEIITATPEDSAFSNTSPVVLCADGGYRLAQNEDIVPHVIIGDFDTFDGMDDDTPNAGQIIRVPVEKDDTDTMLCIKYGLEQGCDSFVMIGGIGGRLDHTFANLQAMAYLASRGVNATMKDEETCVTLLTPGTHTLHRSEYRRFSLFSYSPACEGLSVHGAKYELEQGRLEYTFPLGVSNEFKNDTVDISFTEGMLLVIMNHQR